MPREYQPLYNHDTGDWFVIAHDWPDEYWFVFAGPMSEDVAKAAARGLRAE